MSLKPDKYTNKPLQHDLRLKKALKPTLGWNPIHVDNKVARFRCGNCGTLQGIGTRDMQGEFEHKCPTCGMVHVFNRTPGRWGTKHKLEVDNRQSFAKNPATLPMGLRGTSLAAEILKALQEG